MSDDKVQPTPISEEEYVRFKQFVQDTHGTVRGHLSTELENALREYRQPSNEQDAIHRIEDDVATIKAHLATPEADGGTPLSEAEVPARAESDKPHSNAPRAKKLDWFIGKYYNRDGGMLKLGKAKDSLREEFGFNDGLIEEYADMLLVELDTEPHPEWEQMFMWGSEAERVWDERKEAAEQEAEQHFEEITDE